MIVLLALLVTQTLAFADSGKTKNPLQNEVRAASLSTLQRLLSLYDEGKITEAELKSEIEDEIVTLKNQMLGVHAADAQIIDIEIAKALAEVILSPSLSARQMVIVVHLMEASSKLTKPEVRARRASFVHIIELKNRLAEIQKLGLSSDQERGTVSIIVGAAKIQILTEYGIAYLKDQNLGNEQYEANETLRGLDRWSHAFSEGKITLAEFEYLVGGAISLQELRDLVAPAKKRILPRTHKAAEGGVEKGN